MIAFDAAVAPHTMVQLLRRNATVIQVLFVMLWSVRFVNAVGAPEVPAVAAIVGAVAVRRASTATRGVKARDVFRTPAGRRFLRPVTWLTVAQIAGSAAVSAAAGAAGADEWVVPLVAATIGLFLVGFGRSLRVGAVSRIGVAATVVPLGLPLASSGNALVASTSAAMMVALLSSAWCCALAAQAGAAPDRAAARGRLHTAFTFGQRG